MVAAFARGGGMNACTTKKTGAYRKMKKGKQFLLIVPPSSNLVKYIPIFFYILIEGKY
jgi:hypothetical protein